MNFYLLQSSSSSLVSDTKVEPYEIIEEGKTLSTQQFHLPIQPSKLDSSSSFTDRSRKYYSHITVEKSKGFDETSIATKTPSAQQLEVVIPPVCEAKLVKGLVKRADAKGMHRKKGIRDVKDKIGDEESLSLSK